jgi:hypothetical protein
MGLSAFAGKFSSLLQINMAMHSGHPDEYMELTSLIEGTAWEINDDLVLHLA